MGNFESMFGPSREEIWALLRAQIGGNEVVSDGIWGGPRLEIQAGDWTVTLAEYVIPYAAGRGGVNVIPFTRMCAPFPNPTGFRFSIHHASVFSHFGSLLGLQDIQVGFPEIDKAFVIKSNNEPAVKALCSSDRLRAFVTAQPNFQLSIQDDEAWFTSTFPPTFDALIFDVAEPIREVERLKELYDVFAEMLSRLSEMGIMGQGTGAATI